MERGVNGNGRERREGRKGMATKGP